MTTAGAAAPKIAVVTPAGAGRRRAGRSAPPRPAGGSVIDPLVVEALVARRARLRESRLATLTPRELDVLREMAQGRGNAGIATRLRLSESSVEKHVNAIFAKLGLSGEQAIHRRWRRC